MNTSKKNTDENKVALDANVLLEIVLQRSSWRVAEHALRRHHVSTLAISILSGHLVMYFGQKERDLSVLKYFLKDFQILNMEQADFEWAFNNMRNNDFEDALQLATAIRNGCTHFITFDKKLYDTYKTLPTIKLELLC